MPVQTFDIPQADKTIKGVPMVQYTLNDNQQFAVLGIDFDKEPVEFGAVAMADGSIVTSKPMGKLSEQNFIFQAQVKNSLFNDNWDFDKYSNPEIILLTVA